MGHQLLHLLLSIAVMAKASPPATYASEDAIQNETLCPDMFAPVGDQCIYFASFMQEGRAAGKQVCHSLGGELAAIKTATQLQNIIAEIEQRELSHANFWIDGAFNGTSWNFTNEEPVPLGTPFWYATEEEHSPKNDSTFNCVSITSDSGFLMNDVACDEEHSPLCEHVPLGFNQPEEDQEEAKDPKDEDIRCPSMFTRVLNTCIAFITFFKGSWETAKQTCHSFTDKSSLLLPTDVELLREIYLYLHAEGLDGFDFWIGATDAGHEGVWKDTSGHIIEINAPFWGNSNKPEFIMEPDGDTTENCLALTSNGLHYFRDEDCSSTYNLLCVAPPLTP
ncbi:uncharacterized protein LOC135219546 [Macrobrachium nipponense]|uniref:uncharacterized protein LOC135219546 n=1 Tax=Macrobrachium nipponense TaxID=159736 RepID=UPI0030C827D5